MAKTKALRKKGRPPFEVNEEVIAKVEELASNGLNQVQIAAALGISDETVSRKKRDFVEIVEALERGKSRGIQAVANALFRNATLPSKLNPYGNVTAQTFFLKARAGWAETATSDGQEVQEVIFRRTRPA